MLKRTRFHLQNQLTVRFIQQSTSLVINQTINETIPAELMADIIRYKRIWTKERSQDHWNRIVLRNYTDADWLENFRMSKRSFQQLCEKLQRELEPKAAFLKSREPLPVEKQVAIAVYKLASCAEYRVVASVFGVTKSTVHKCLYRVVNAINKVIVPHEICLPTEMEAKYISTQFEKKCHIPQIIGCIDGTHIPVLAPEEGYRDFVNREGWSSYNVQAIVDHKGRFMNVFAKFSGSAHDARVFEDNSVYQHAGSLIPKTVNKIDGIEIPLMIVGDPAYSLLLWLLKEYAGAASAVEESFNVYLNSARVSVEMAFGRLKARWRILLKRMDVSYKFALQLIVACCALHNFVEKNKDIFLLTWLDEVLESEKLYKQPPPVLNRTRGNVLAQMRRDHLKRYLAKNYPLRKSVFRSN